MTTPGAPSGARGQTLVSAVASPEQLVGCSRVESRAATDAGQTVPLRLVWVVGEERADRVAAGARVAATDDVAGGGGVQPRRCGQTCAGAPVPTGCVGAAPRSAELPPPGVWTGAQGGACAAVLRGPPPTCTGVRAAAKASSCQQGDVRFASARRGTGGPTPGDREAGGVVASNPRGPPCTCSAAPCVCVSRPRAACVPVFCPLPRPLRWPRRSGVWRPASPRPRPFSVAPRTRAPHAGGRRRPPPPPPAAGAPPPPPPAAAPGPRGRRPPGAPPAAGGGGFPPPPPPSPPRRCCHNQSRRRRRL